MEKHTLEELQKEQARYFDLLTKRIGDAERFYAELSIGNNRITVTELYVGIYDGENLGFYESTFLRSLKDFNAMVEGYLAEHFPTDTNN